MTPIATTAGFRVSVKGRRVYLVDAEPTSDPGMSHHEAKELAQRLLCAAHAAERAARPSPQPERGRPADGRRPLDRSWTPSRSGR
jgi:hypothetical protein